MSFLPIAEKLNQWIAQAHQDDSIEVLVVPIIGEADRPYHLIEGKATVDTLTLAYATGPRAKRGGYSLDVCAWEGDTAHLVGRKLRFSADGEPGCVLFGRERDTQHAMRALGVLT